MTNSVRLQGMGVLVQEGEAGEGLHMTHTLTAAVSSTRRCNFRWLETESMGLCQ
jgi:hypothetical protein